MEGYKQCRKVVSNTQKGLKDKNVGFSTQTTFNKVKSAASATLRTMGNMGFNVKPESFKLNPYVSLNFKQPSAPIKVNKDFENKKFMQGMITQKRRGAR